MKRTFRFLVMFVALSLVLPLATAWADNDNMPAASQKGQDEANMERPASFSVPAQLRSQVQTQVEENKDIREVKVSSEDKKVEVHYKLRARLFGFITVPYELQASVDTKNNNMVQTKAPWWLLFATDNSGEVTQALENDTTLTQDTNQGQILSRIISIIKSLAK